MHVNLFSGVSSAQEGVLDCISFHSSEPMDSTSGVLDIYNQNNCTINREELKIPAGRRLSGKQQEGVSDGEDAEPLGLEKEQKVIIKD